MDFPESNPENSREQNLADDGQGCAVVQPSLDSSADNDRPSNRSKMQSLDKLLSSLKDIPEAKDQLDFLLQQLEMTLCSSSRDINLFWQLRKHALPIFKENIPLNVRETSWAKFTDLSQQAKNIRDAEESASNFAVEQIEIAIADLESLIIVSESGEQSVSADFGRKFIDDLKNQINLPRSLQDRKDYYLGVQSELQLLNSLATRVNSLRKEVLKTNMRIKFKNNFFQRLSKLGDAIFPKRRSLIDSLSAEFSHDVQQYTQGYFVKNFEKYLYDLREDIKSLQALAKVLSLNTASFAATRMQLSSCWDKVKVAEKQRRKDKALQKADQKQNFIALQTEIESLISTYENSSSPNVNEFSAQILEVKNRMRKIDLGRDDVKDLKEKIYAFEKVLTAVFDEEKKQRAEVEANLKKEKEVALKSLLEDIEQLFNSAEDSSVESLSVEATNILNKADSLKLSKFEKSDIERRLKPLKEIIADKNEKALLDLSKDDQTALRQLEIVLKSRLDRKAEVKKRIDALRKSLGATSNADIAFAMQQNELMSEEKELMEKITLSIQETESQIRLLKKGS